MVGKIDHIGIVVANLESSMARYQTILGLQLKEIEEIEVDGAILRVAFFPAGDTNIELVHTMAKNGLAADFLRDHGEGIHHIAFAVDDLKSIFDTLLGQGVSFLWDRIIPGSRGSQVAFFQPKEFNGVYIELVQR
ncbi:VOC family protein [uncultured Desulfosarcina sp.]|uniref:VOC family protein n=1 Tax=uncultured Desulfosarcina sp. TaxID=218289 RepID=UPI0029C8BDE8|nr:VOC family protein [uncultured Desulfosarcina sp.]